MRERKENEKVIGNKRAENKAGIGELHHRSSMINLTHSDIRNFAAMHSTYSRYIIDYPYYEQLRTRLKTSPSSSLGHNPGMSVGLRD